MKIDELLRQSGVKMNDTAVVYCALESRDLPVTPLLEALTAFFTPGTLVMPTGHDAAAAVPNGVFDPDSTPSGEGALSELFRKLPGTVRSRHPSGSLAFLGRDAQWLAEGHERCASEFSASSPWWKLFQTGAKCIFVNCGLERSGMIAACEEWAGAAAISQRSYRRRLALNGKNKQLKIKLHIRKHHLNYPKAEELLRDAGFLSRSRWGTCDIIVLNSAPAAELLLQLLRRKPGLFASRRRLRLKKS